MSLRERVSRARGAMSSCVTEQAQTPRLRGLGGKNQRKRAEQGKGKPFSIIRVRPHMHKNNDTESSGYQLELAAYLAFFYAYLAYIINQSSVGRVT